MHIITKTARQPKLLESLENNKSLKQPESISQELKFSPSTWWWEIGRNIFIQQLLQVINDRNW